jgi:hypothetical protein
MKNPLLRLLLAVPLVVALAGCGDDGDSNPGGPGTQPLDQETAQAAALDAIEIIDGLNTIADDLFSTGPNALGSAIFRATAGDGPVYDEETQTWTYAVSYTEGSNSYSRSASLQYYAGGTPVESYEAATGLSLNQSLNTDVTFTGEGTTVHTVLGYVASLDVDEVTTRGGGSTYAVGGTGALVGNLSGATTQGAFNYALNMNWAYDVVVPAAGCPSGTMSFYIDDWTLNVTYNAVSSNYDWTMLYAGEVVDSGTEFSSCGL